MKKNRKLVESNLSEKLFRQVRTLIEQSKKMVSLTVNQELTLLNWSIGKLVHHTLLKEHRAEYGEKIVATLSQQLSWSHFNELTGIDIPLKRAFYMEMAIKENWSIRNLRERIDSMLFERTGITNYSLFLVVII